MKKILAFLMLLMAGFSWSGSYAPPAWPVGTPTYDIPIHDSGYQNMILWTETTPVVTPVYSPTPTPVSLNVSLTLPKNYLVGIDSLTCNAPGTGGTATELRSKLQSKFGNAGPGLQMFDKVVATVEASTYTESAGATLAGEAGAQWGFPDTYYSWIGQCASFANGSGSDYFTWDSGTNVQYVRLYYLKIVGGGTCNATVNGVTQSLSCSSASTIISQIDFAPNGASSSVSIGAIAGHVVLFGAFFWNDNGGICVSRWGEMGNKIFNFSFLSSDMMRQWAALVHPENLIVNGGMNDAVAGFDVNLVGTPVAALESEFHKGSKDTKIFWLAPDRIDVGAYPTQVAILSNHRSMYESLAFANPNNFFLDVGNPYCFGTHANAVANGWMLDDVHVSSSGATQIVNYEVKNIQPPRTFFNFFPPTPVPYRIGDTYVDQSGPGTLWSSFNGTSWTQVKP